MKNTMVGMLPSGTYVLARLDGTPYSQGEYEMLLRDFDVATAEVKRLTADDGNSHLRRQAAISVLSECDTLRATIASQAKRLEAYEALVKSADECHAGLSSHADGLGFPVDRDICNEYEQNKKALDAALSS